MEEKCKYINGYVVDDFKQVQKVISEADETYSVLIENDLPDNYK